MKTVYLQVVLPVPLNRTFTYAYNGDGNYKGCRVLVSFGRGRMARELTGIVIEQSDILNILDKNLKEKEIKYVIEILDIRPIFSDTMLKFLIWLSDYYFAPIGETIKAAIPSGISPKSLFKFVINKNIESYNITNNFNIDSYNINSIQKKILQYLSDSKIGCTIDQIQEYCNINNIRENINYLLENNFIEIETERVVKVKIKTQKIVKIASKFINDNELLKKTLLNLDKRAIKQSQILMYLFLKASKNNPAVPLSELLETFKGSSSSIKTLISKELIYTYDEEVNRNIQLKQYESLATKDESMLNLTSEQLRCVEEINKSIESNNFMPFLLHGITGSGKTLVYINTIKKALELKKTVLLLVPEISLTPQLIDRFNVVFPNLIAVFHSKMSNGERYDSWRSVINNEVKIVIGARSALFMPLNNLGLIIIDEEHEVSYKQDSALPFYQARDSAIYRAMLEKATIVLGSATPSLESYYNISLNKINLLEIKHRADKAILPNIELVDMISAKKTGQSINGFSFLLLNKIKEKLRKKEGIILFQNKRGFANFIECNDCGYIPQCKYCSTSLTYHQTTNELKCHYCGYSKKLNNICEVCGNVGMDKVGTGTQRVEDTLSKILADDGFNCKIERLDLDTTQRKGSYRKILQSFAAGDTDILLGTQMVAKGLDFDRVTLVGVINADIQLNIPDFRASERTFQLISQVAGRAGRGQNLLGEVIIQTSNIMNYAIITAAKADFQKFYQIEIKKRYEAMFPPFVRFCIIEFISNNEEKVIKQANIFYSLIIKHKVIIVYPPQPAILTKLNKKFRWQITIKNIKSIDTNGRYLRKIINDAMEKYATYAIKDVSVKIDIDAYSAL